ncbi:MAG: hypothetical protein IJI97_05840 [Clostridia bacterium]|jgi:hypothetical protein|nr:hypothetical protein [Clostridia bacterium]
MYGVLPRSLAKMALINTHIEEWRENHLVDDYSGRGMDGAKCFGLIGDFRLLAKFLVAMAELEMMEYPDDGGEYNPGDNEAKWAIRLADEVVSDRMGHDTIYYFPGIKLSEV